MTPVGDDAAEALRDKLGGPSRGGSHDGAATEHGLGGHATERLRAFLTDRVYINSAAKVEEHKAKDLLVSLYNYYTERPDELPPLYRRIADEDGRKIAVADFISCMTDRYAVDLFRRLFVPDVWRGGAV